jgi:hypothetical protein
VYIGGTEANCGNGPSYFADIANASASFLNNLRNSTSETNSATVHMNYCIPSQTLSGIKSTSETYQVSQFIKSTQSINSGLSVKYQANTYIELNPGFSSGTDFVAEINPCVSLISYIAYKTDDTEQDENTLPISETKYSSNWLKIYPTILPTGNSITIQTNEDVNGVELQMYDIQGRHTKSFRLNNFVEGSSTTVSIDVPAGVYVIKGYNGKDLFTQKIIVQ